MKRYAIFWIILFLGNGIIAQTKHTQDSVIKDPQPSHYKKSVLTTDTLTQSDYMMSIDRVNDYLNSIRDSAGLGFETERMKRSVEDLTGDINLIRQNVRIRNSVTNIKNLYLYKSFASDLDNENSRIKVHLARTYHRVYNSKLRLKVILSDSVFRALYSNSSLQKPFELKLARLERKWMRTDSLAKANIDSLNTLKVKVADNSVNLSNMLNIMDIRLDKAGKQLFSNEADFLWQINKKDTLAVRPSKRINLLDSQEKVLNYYFTEISDKRVVIFFFGILLFVWLFFKRKFLNVLSKPDESLGFLRLKYLNSYPVLSLVIIVLCLMTFFDANAPTTYIAVLYFILLIVLSFVFFKRGDLNFSFSWMMLVILFIVNALTYLLMEPTLMARLWMLAININIIVFSFLFMRKLNTDLSYYKWIKRASIIAVILSVLCVLSNIFGRVTLSGIFGISAIFAITQAVILPVFIEIITEVILVQIQSSRMKTSYDRPFNTSIVIERIRMPLGIMAMILWLIMLLSNLILYHDLTDTVNTMLSAPRSIGSISFKLINVVWFFIVIWFAHILQKVISYLFGESGITKEDISPISKKQKSRLLITRLLVLVGGYMLAIAASGLPVDKLTFLLGALGLGIGMGLQNVVNNFVSGIILIFEGMLQIGDVIEVGGQSGKVKEIGLRASTLNTAEGSEVIIPNGTILSQNVVNWTLSDDQKRVTVWFSLTGKELDSNKINEVINSTINNIPDVITQKKPVILYNRVTPETYAITVRFWSTINNADNVKSESLLQLGAAFASKGIGFK